MKKNMQLLTSVSFLHNFLHGFKQRSGDTFVEVMSNRLNMLYSMLLEINLARFLTLDSIQTIFFEMFTQVSERKI